MNLKILIAVNRRDLWFCRICVASIRYFYPEIDIVLIKDEVNGSFSTRELELKFNVKIYPTPIKKFGWAASKTFFLLEIPKGEKWLILDADIVFVGPFLERLYSYYDHSDIIVSPEYYKDVYCEPVKQTYFDFKKIKEFDGSYKYQGYFFNTGQLFVKGGIINEEHLAPFFSTTQFPYWLKPETFPLVDQSVYNYLFPKLHQEGQLKLKDVPFMLWSECEEAQEVKFEEVVARENKTGLIHWAGAKRTPYISRMTRADLLQFFENEYYEKIFFSTIKRRQRKLSHVGLSILHRLKNKIAREYKNMAK